ncbi:MAG: hypothetical protein IKB12_10150 [Clostridia bacterium]|nr:hypothetical protein [Clostridia bacterium]
MEKKIYTIATAHLDTVWNWDFEHVINVCLKETLDQNFNHFSNYPDYRFNFEGSYRYELFEEYYPEKFEQLREYINEGKWNVTGSAFENGDVNVPSPESLFRNILYGNKYFEKKFGKKSNDIFLPDCFGFGYALPSIMNHAGLKGFSTQKLSWGSAYGIPYDIGLWYGPDGKHVFASLDAKSYCTTFRKIRTKKSLLSKLEHNIKNHDLPVTFAYHGVGDVGGAPKEESVKTLTREMADNEKEEIKVLSSSPTEFFEDMAALDKEAIEKLPVWKNELPMTDHGVGSYVSRAFSKRMNRRNEEIADMAERNSVIAMDVCGKSYPKAEIDRGWKRTIAHTFHDDITGTSVERVYQRSWNDLVMSANQLTNAYEGSAAEIIKNMDTSFVEGIAVVLNNSIEQPRMAAVDLKIPSKGYKYIRAFDADGKEVPSQVNKNEDGEMEISVAAYVPALGYKVIDVRYSTEPCRMKTGLRANTNVIENYKYVVRVDANGDIYSIIDKMNNGAEILKKPIRFELNKYKGAKEYAAWELRYDELDKYPWEFAEKGQCEILEKGPVRVSLKVTQKCQKSTFSYIVSLAAGCPWVSVYNEIEWREFRRALHNGFSFNVSNKTGTFDLGLGTISRKTANKKLYEVAAQKWADITDTSGQWGVSVFSDSKYGWMMKDERTLRLTVVHSPKNYYRHDSVQGMLDFGLNRYGYAIYSHKGDYTNGTQLNARFFDQPVTAFITGKHKGSLGTEFSFGAINSSDVIIRAIKKAEESDEIIVRVNEGAKKSLQGVTLTLGNGIESAREVNAMEEEIGEVTVNGGKIIFGIKPYEVKTFALTLKKGDTASKTEYKPVELPYNRDIVTFNHDRNSASIPTINVSIPGEIFPKTIECGGVKFATGDIWGEGNNALICAGQEIAAYGNKLYFVGASLYDDKEYTFLLDGKEKKIKVQSINGRIGKWDLYNLSEVAEIKTDKLAWECTHTHSPQGDNAAQQLLFFMYEIDTEGVETVTLPDDNGLIILSAAQTSDTESAVLETPLYDRVSGRKFNYKMSGKEKRRDRAQKRIFKKPHNKS